MRTIRLSVCLCVHFNPVNLERKLIEISNFAEMFLRHIWKTHSCREFQGRVGPLNFQIGYNWKKSAAEMSTTGILMVWVWQGFSRSSYAGKLTLVVFPKCPTAHGYCYAQESFTGTAVYRSGHSAADLVVYFFTSLSYSLIIRADDVESRRRYCDHHVMTCVCVVYVWEC